MDRTTARGLGLASLGVAATEMAAAHQLEDIMGIGNGENTGILRVLAVREFMHGFDILMHKNPTPGVWGRVAGDILDNVLLAVAGAKSRKPAGLAAVAAVVMPLVIADILCATMLTAKAVR